jgi:hypothetical protein
MKPLSRCWPRGLFRKQNGLVRFTSNPASSTEGLRTSKSVIFGYLVFNGRRVERRGATNAAGAAETRAARRELRSRPHPGRGLVSLFSTIQGIAIQ